MDSKWQKMNSVLFHKIKEYDRQHMENHYDIHDFEIKNKKLFQEIQQHSHKHKCLYSFPRKIHQSQKMSDKQDTHLAQQLSGKTYNLYQQNPHHDSNRDTRHSSFHIGKPSSKNQFVVRKNNRLQLSQDKQKKLASSQTSKSSVSQRFSRVLKQSDIKNVQVNNKNHRDIPMNVNVLRTMKDSKQILIPLTLKKRSIIARNYSSGSLKQNRMQNTMYQPLTSIKRVLKSKFNNELKVLKRLATEIQE